MGIAPCHCEERSDAAISIVVPTGPRLLRFARNDNENRGDERSSRCHSIALQRYCTNACGGLLCSARNDGGKAGKPTLESETLTFPSPGATAPARLAQEEFP